MTPGPGLLPRRCRLPAGPAPRGESQHLDRCACEIERLSERVDEHGRRLVPLLLHRSRRVDKEGHSDIGERAETTLPEDPMLDGIGDDHGQAGRIQFTVVLGKGPAVLGRTSERSDQPLGDRAALTACAFRCRSSSARNPGSRFGATSASPPTSRSKARVKTW